MLKRTQLGATWRATAPYHYGSIATRAAARKNSGRTSVTEPAASDCSETTRNVMMASPVHLTRSDRVNGWRGEIEVPELTNDRATDESMTRRSVRSRYGCPRVTGSRTHLQGVHPSENPFTQHWLFTADVADTLLDFSLSKAFPPSAMAKPPPLMRFFWVRCLEYGPSWHFRVSLNRRVDIVSREIVGLCEVFEPFLDFLPLETPTKTAQLRNCHC
jgi:hypothetical protein